MPKIVNGEIVSSPSSRRQNTGTSTGGGGGGGGAVGFSYDSSGRRIEDEADTNGTRNDIDLSSVLRTLRSKPALLIIVLFVLAILVGPQLCMVILVFYGLLKVFSYVPPKPGSQTRSTGENRATSGEARRTGLYTLADTNV